MFTSGRRAAGAFAGIVAAALVLRLTSFSTVFSEKGIWFLEYDSFYHMRRIVHAALDFPNVISFDTYVNYPEGFTLGWPPLFDGLIAACAYIFGFGSPSIAVIETVAVFFPVAIGVLTLVPVFYIGRELFGSEEYGLMAAAFLAILPAHVIVSVLGFVDHHVFEVLLFACMILLALCAVRRPDQISHWAVLLSAGFLIAIYSFPSAPIFIGIIGLAVVGWFILRRIRAQDTIDILRFGAIAFGSAGLATLVLNAGIAGAREVGGMGEISLFQPAYFLLWFLVLGIAGVLAEVLRERPWQVYIGALAGGGGAGAVIVYAALPPFWNALVGGLAYIRGVDPILGTIVEAGSILAPAGFFTLSPLWELYSIPLVLGIGGFLVYCAGRVKDRMFDDADLLLAIVFIVSFTLPLIQMRFLNVLAVPLALTAGYGTMRVLEGLGMRKRLVAFLGSDHSDRHPMRPAPGTEPVSREATAPGNETSDKKPAVQEREVPPGKQAARGRETPAGRKTAPGKPGKKKQKKTKTPADDPTKTYRTVAVLVFALLVIVPTVYSASGMYMRVGDMPDEDLIDAMLFLRDETPDPGGFFDTSVTPEYGVMSFWSYGNLIIYYGERPAVANNFQTGIVDSARFFTSSGEHEASLIADERNVRYVVTVDISSGIFADHLEWSGVDVSDLTYDDFMSRYVQSMYFRLHERDAEGLAAYTLIYASPERPDGTSLVKIFLYDP